MNSVVADSIGIQPAKLSSQCAIRGFTEYPSGHGLAYEFVNYYKGHILIGKVPVSPTLVYWFVTRQSSPRGKLVDNIYRKIYLCRFIILNFNMLLGLSGLSNSQLLIH